MYDLVIENARICDGTGMPSYMGTLGVEEGLITYLGTEKGLASKRTVDAEGLVLSPGFIDPHTHYDAQVAWDPLLTSSPWHGVTTVVMGNCGVGVAPVKPETRDILLHDLVNVEAIPYEVMQAGIDWQWESYGEYMDALDRRGMGINVAGLMAFTPLRHYVMGEASFERTATDDEIAVMRGLLREAMEHGAFGFTTTTIRNHIGHEGRPLACRNASLEELRGLCHALRDVGRGSIEISVNSGGTRVINDEDMALLQMLSDESTRPITWLALFARPGDPDFHEQTIAKMGDLIYKAVPQVTPKPLITQGDLKNPFMFGPYKSWEKVFNRPVDEQMAFYRDPEFREAFLQDMKGHERHHMWSRMSVLDYVNPDLAKYQGRTVQDIADEEGKRAMDVYLDIGLADRLETRFQIQAFNYDTEGVKRLVSEDRFMVGLSDGGAHVDLLCDVGYSTALLQRWVREQPVLSLERAVKKLTSVPAAVFGIPNRGVLVPGKVADLVLFDPDRVTSKQPEFANDFPLGGRRLIAKAEGIEATFLAGTQLYNNGEHTGELPGRILRSYE